MVIEAATNTAYEKWLQESEDSIIILDKATSNTGGKVALSDIGDALKEYERVFKAG